MPAGQDLLFIEVKQYNRSCQVLVMVNRGTRGRVLEAMQTDLHDEYIALTTLPKMFPINLALIGAAGILYKEFLSL